MKKANYVMVEGLKMDIHEDFKKYDNPQAAERIWAECLPEINQFGCYDSAYSILTNSRRANLLDVKLNRLLSNRERTRGR